MTTPVSSNAAGSLIEVVEEVLEGGEIAAGVAPAPNTSVLSIAAGAVIPTFWKTTFSRIFHGPTYPTWNYSFEVALNVIRSVLYHQKAAQKMYYSDIPLADRRRTVLLRYKETRRTIDGGVEKHRYNSEGVTFENCAIQRKNFSQYWKTGTELDDVIKHDGVLDAEWVSHKNSADNRVIVYFHGGAYAAMSAKTHRGITSHLARAAKCGVLAVNYRLAPEHQFPAAIHDALVAYLHVIKTLRLDPSRVIIAGDSAGGGLTASLIHYIRNYGNKLGVPQPAGAVLISAWLDLSGCSGPSWTDRDIPDYIPFFEEVPTRDWWDPSVLYMGKHPLNHPLASTIWADWNDLPPVFAQYGTLERLKSDGDMLAKKLEEQGLPGSWTVEFYPGGIHVFHGFMNLMSEGRLAMEHLCQFLHDIWERNEKSNMIGRGLRTIRPA